MKMKITKTLVFLMMSAVIGGAGYMLYLINDRFVDLQHALIQMEQRLQDCQVQPAKQQSKQKSMIEGSTTAMNSALWLDLQQTLNNTVVQIFVVKAEKNVLQPYRIPSPSQASGSGFIISKDGEIITNAHVVNQTTSIVIQMPAFGKHQFEADLVGIMPEKDFALLKLKPYDVELIKKTLGDISTLPLGDSDTVLRSQEILALGYPLGQESLKSTTGVISGRESGMIQMSAPINPGSSGGPSIDTHGHVVGINTAGITEAQNVGYIVPINDLKTFLSDLREGGLIRKPYIGIYQSMATPELVKALGNPEPGGTYVVEVLHDSPLKGQLESGDMIYEINGIPIDLYGELVVPWSEDKVSTAEYIARLKVGQQVSLTVYRKGEKKKFVCTFDRKKLSPIRQMFPGYEELEYEAFGGYIVMPLMINHLPHLLKIAPNLSKYAQEKYQSEPVLVVTYLLPDSPAYRARLRIVGSVLKKVNGHKVATLADLKDALAQSGDQITVETTDNILVALSKENVLKQEKQLARTFGYQVTPAMQQLLDEK